MPKPDPPAPAAGKPSPTHAACWALGLSAYFVAVYTTCNWLASLRHDVGTCYMPWELAFPLVPWMIYPYMSIDLFFVGSLFVCGDRAELRTLARRIVAAITIAGVCFVLFPLRVGYPQPRVAGMSGMWFHLLWTFDRPHNLVPSLHIALWALLGVVYVRHTAGLLRLAVRVWFFLIAISTLFTWQHHVIDVVAGAGLAALCFYLFPESLRHDVPRARELGSHRRRIGGYYALGSAVCLAAAVTQCGWGWLLLWPALALALVTAGYWSIGSRVFRKRDGRLPLSTWCCLGPYLLGAWLSLLCRIRRVRLYDQVVPNLYLGRRPMPWEIRAIHALGVTTVLDLTAEFSEPAALHRPGHYHNIPMLDLVAPAPAQLAQAVALVRQFLSQGPVYVHCALGYSRSACVAAAYLLATGQARDVGHAVQIVAAARPRIVLPAEFLQVLQEYSAGINVLDHPRPLPVAAHP